MAPLSRAIVLCVISLSLAGGDVVQTAPPTWSLYKRQWIRRRLSPVCLLFFLFRYLSLLALAGYGYLTFESDFTYAECKGIYWAPLVAGSLAGLSAQALLALRVHQISGRPKRLGFALGALLILFVPMQIFGAVYHQDPVFQDGYCQAKSLHSGEPKWPMMYSTLHTIFDLATSVVATDATIRASIVRGALQPRILMRRSISHGVPFFVVVLIANFWIMLESAGVFVSHAAPILPLTLQFIAVQHMILDSQRRSPEELKTGFESVSVGPPQFRVQANNETMDLDDDDDDAILPEPVGNKIFKGSYSSDEPSSSGASRLQRDILDA